MSLAEWHDKLSEHFHRLHQQRSKEGDNPVFSLEHGLTEQEVLQLKDEIRAYIQSYKPNKHWLPWVVYAAEFGYEYRGHEYWQTFEERTPGWTDNCSPDWLRERYRKFRDEYGGANPSGSWARNFSIICWPITHAILPKDFQSKLTKVLSDIQHLFTIEILQSTSRLGELISAHSLYPSQRFQQFVQDVSMVGLIAKALLTHEEQSADRILLSGTLQRIVRDLERELDARERLREARYYAREVERSGLSSATRSQRTGSTQFQTTRTRSSVPTVEPRIILRQLSPTTWESLLEIPNFSPLLSRLPALRSFLDTSRAIVRGASSGNRIASGQLLWNSHLATLRTWPKPDEPALQFEGTAPEELAGLLGTQFTFRSKPVWLFSIGSDGRASELLAPLVRPQRRYIVLSTTGPIRNNPITTPLEITCNGVFAARLDVPESISASCKAYIESLGLKVAKKVSVWPAGIVAAKWDGEGRGEWLTTDKPCIGIHIDHSVDAILMELIDGEGESIKAHLQEFVSPVFIQLPQLRSGLHNLFVTSRDMPTDEYEELGQLEILMREPQTWRPGISNQGALIVIADPRSPTLEQLLGGQFNLEIHGPDGRHANCTATFLGKDLDNPLTPPIKLPTLRLPVKAATWKAYVDKQLQNTEIPERQSAIELAYYCRIDFDAEELGTFSITCERELDPLRWVVEREGQSYLLSLADDSGHNERSEIFRYNFTKPDVRLSVPANKSFHKQEVPLSGGLYVAHNQQAQCSVILPLNIEVKTLADMQQLHFVPEPRHRQRNIQSLIEVLKLYELWSTSKITGGLKARTPQHRVLDALVKQIFKVIGGDRWAEAESAYCSNPESQNAMQRLSKVISDKFDLNAAILNHYQLYKDAMPKEHANNLASGFKQALSPIHLSNTPLAVITGNVRVIRGRREDWQAEFALRLASAPETVQNWSDEWLEAGLNGLLQKPELARAARFLVLITNHYLQGTERGRSPMSLYKGWDW